MSYTITEALQEIKTINKRIEVKRNGIGLYLVRDSRVKDPFEKDGGSFEYVKRERQAISDLEKRIVLIRTKIQEANFKASLVVNGETKTIQEWLNWRKEVAVGTKSFLNAMSNAIKKMRDNMTKEGRTLVAAENEQSAQKAELVVQVDEKELLKEIENFEITFSELDGKLSHANATITIEV